MRANTIKYETFEADGSPCTASRLATSLTLAAMSLGYGVVQLDVTIVNTALDAMGKTLGGGVAELQWVVSAYTIAFAAFILTAGALGDRIGAKRIFMAGFAIFTAASLACALSPNAIALIGARLVQGLAAAILVPNSLALLNHAYADDRARGRAVAVWAAGHILVNGDRAGLVLFVAMLALALFGTSSIDAKRKRALGSKWDAFAAETSNVPFGAILSGRQKLAVGEIGWWRIFLGVAVWALLAWAHPFLFGVKALP